MRACVQRVSRGKVTVEGRVVGEIAHGLLVLLGVTQGDTQKDASFMATKLIGLRIFQDHDDKMNRSLIESGGSMLVVSQFTLLGDCRKGRRPSFVAAAEPELAKQLYEHFVAEVRRGGVQVATGIFQAQMDVEIVNSGPVTLLVDSKKAF